MKNLVLYLIVLFSFSKLTAQITLDNVYTGNGYDLYLTKLHLSGYKYVKNDFSNMTITLYNTNHSVFKTIVIPPLNAPLSGSTAFYVSENLFDLDSFVEYVVTTYSAGIPRVYVLKENGVILLQKDSAAISGTDFGNVMHNRNGVYHDGTSTKMRLELFANYSTNNKSAIYTLPGTLLCSQCNENGTVTDMPTSPSGTGNNGTALFYPNPVTDQLKLKYTLPIGYKTAEINIYDLQGKLVENFKVTDTFDFIYLPSDYNNGMYLYTLLVDGKILKTEKVLLNK